MATLSVKFDLFTSTLNEISLFVFPICYICKGVVFYSKKVQDTHVINRKEFVSNTWTDYSSNGRTDRQKTRYIYAPVKIFTPYIHSD